MRWMIRSVMALGLLVIVLVAALFMIPVERIAGVAIQRFELITGRSLTMNGSVRPTIWPTLGVKTGPVTVSNADWSTEGPFLSAEALEIGLDFQALIDGSVRITDLRAIGPRLILERAKDGRANWVFGGENGGTAQAGMAGEGTPFTLDLAEIKDGAITFIDHGAGRRMSLAEIEGEVHIPSFTGPAEANFAAAINGQPIKAKLAVAEFAPFLDGRLVGFGLNLTAGAAKFDFSGRFGWKPATAEGVIDSDFASLSEVARLMGATRPNLPLGLGANALKIKGNLTLAKAGSLHLRDGKVQLDQNLIEIDADLSTKGDRPKLVASVAAPTFVLGQSTTQGSGAAATGTRGWSTAPIDMSGLGVMDAEVGFSADSVRVGSLQLGTTRAKMVLDRARAVFDLRQISAYDGRASGQFVLNARGGLSVGADLQLAGLSMQSLMDDLMRYNRLISKGDMSLKFLAVGNSLDELMRSLSGSGRIALGKGELLGLDIAGMLRTLDAGFVGEGQKTIFDGISASFTMEKGVLFNPDLALSAPYITATGSGELGIGAQTLNYRLRPTALASTDGTGGVMVPLLITGTWANPKFRLDLESIARERLEAEAKALEERAREEAKAAEAKAKAELEKKAAEKLGVERQEGETLEDAAKRRAQEALDAEAARLLNRLIGNGN